MGSSASFQRLVYTSRSRAVDDAALDADVRSILAAAGRFNAPAGVSGLLTVCDGHYLQWLDGPAGPVGDLYDRICADRRHTEVELLSLKAVPEPAFSDWSLGLVERAETSASFQARVWAMKQWLATDSTATPADFFRWLLTPAATQYTGVRDQKVNDVLVISPGGLWARGVVEQLAADSSTRISRTSIQSPEHGALPTPFEYADGSLAGVGLVRVISAPSHELGLSALLTLISDLALVVLLLAPSDIGALREPAFAAALGNLLRRARSVLVLSSAGPERLREITPLLSSAGGRLECLPTRLGRAGDVWRTIQSFLRESPLQAAAAPVPVPVALQLPLPSPPAPPASGPPALRASPSPLRSQSLPAPVPVAPPPPTANAPPAPAQAVAAAREGLSPSDAALAASLLPRLHGVSGVLAAGVLCLRSGHWAEQAAPGQAAAPGLGAFAAFVSAQTQLLQRLHADDRLQELALITPCHWLLAWLLPAPPPGHAALAGLCVVDREQMPLAAARLRIQEVLAPTA